MTLVEWRRAHSAPRRRRLRLPGHSGARHDRHRRTAAAPPPDRRAATTQRRSPRRARPTSASPSPRSRRCAPSSPGRRSAEPAVMPRVSRAVEERNRRHAARPRRDGPRVRAAARHPGPRPDRARLGGALHPRVPRDVRRDAAPLPAAPPRRARDVPAARDRPQRDRDLPRRRVRSLGTFSRTFRDIVGESPSAYRRRAVRRRRPDVLRDGVDATEQFRRSARGGARASVADMPITALTHLADLRPRPGRGARLLRRQARPGGRRGRRHGLHALAHRQRPRRRRTARSCSSGPGRRR